MTHPSIPLTILTGFLGSGKTTLLNHLLTFDHGRRVAVLVNDFGSINIDAELVVGVEDNMMSLANGCVCCEIRDDLLDAVENLVTSDTPPEHMVLEASGVAEPSGIWATFAGSQHPEWVRLDGVICVVDTEQIFTNLDDAPDLLMLKARQIAYADLVVLNKIDLAGADMVAWVRKWIDSMMERVRLVEAVHARVPLDVLLGMTRTDRPLLAMDSNGGDDHGTRFKTWTYETTRLFNPDALEEMVSRVLPGTIYRCKGFVQVDGQDPATMLLQTVGRRTELTRLDDNTERVDRSRIVAIGIDTLDETALQQAFDSCLAQPTRTP